MCRNPDLDGGPYFPQQEALEGEHYWPPYWWVIVLAAVCLVIISCVEN